MEEVAAAPSPAKKFSPLIFLYLAAAVALAVGLYIHITDPVTTQFLKEHNLQVVHVDSAEETSYIDKCIQMLRVTYAISAAGFIVALVAAWQRSKLTYVLIPVLVVLIVLQLGDYYQSLKMYEAYSIISMGV